MTHQLKTNLLPPRDKCVLKRHKLLRIAIVHNSAFLLLTQCSRQFEVHHTDMNNEVTLEIERFLTARPLAAVGTQVEMQYFVILQKTNVSKRLVASHKGAAKLAVSGVEMILRRLSSGSHSAVLYFFVQ